MFFQLMAKGLDTAITNVKQVEPLVQAKRDKVAWSILTAPTISDAHRVKEVVSIMLEKKTLRKAEDKIRSFIAWLEDAEDLTPKSKELLSKVADLATTKSRV